MLKNQNIKLLTVILLFLFFLVSHATAGLTYKSENIANWSNWDWYDFDPTIPGMAWHRYGYDRHYIHFNLSASGKFYGTPGQWGLIVWLENLGFPNHCLAVDKDNNLYIYSAVGYTSWIEQAFSTNGAGSPYYKTYGPYNDFRDTYHPQTLYFVSGGRTKYVFTPKNRVSQHPGEEFHHFINLVISLKLPPTDLEDPEETGCTSRKSPGQMSYTVGTMLVNLVLVDTPVAYKPPYGPEIDFTLYYNQREASEPEFMGYGNVSSHWSHNWLAFDEDAPADPNSTSVQLWPRQTGIRRYTDYNPATGHYQRPQKDNSNLRKTSPSSYERTFPDGSREIYSAAAPALNGVRRIFLSQVIDPQGNVVTLTYDTVPVEREGQTVQAMRVATVTDAAGGVNTLHYHHATNPLLVTGVTDRFGRTAVIGYDAVSRLASLSDVQGLQSSVAYEGTGTRVTSMTNSYGTTQFSYFESGRFKRLIVTDPAGAQEKYEFRPEEPMLASWDEPVPVGFSADLLRYGNTFLWNKDAMAQGLGDDITKATVMHWSRTRYETTGTLSSIKQPGLRRQWLGYEGQDANRYFEGATRNVTDVAKVLDDGSDTTQRLQATYNSVGNLLSTTDPLGRQLSYIYDSSGVDLSEVRVTTGTSEELLAAFTYYPDGRHLVHTATDASGATTAYTYTPHGQLATATNALGEVTTYSYNAQGLLAAIDGPLPGASDRTTFTYDIALSRHLPSAVTYSDGYSVNFQYDAFDRTTQIMYPDGTFEQFVYDRLLLSAWRDRAGRWTHYVVNHDRQLVEQRDPLDKVTRFLRTPQGHLQSLIDPLGRVTRWERDLNGLITQKLYPDGTSLQLDYDANARLVAQTDTQGRSARFQYFADNRLKRQWFTYSDGSPIPGMPEVAFTYQTNYPRLASISDGSGLTHYNYHPAGQPGAGQVAIIDGPLAEDTITFSYDALGRVTERSINGAANQITLAYDALGRIAQTSNNLGTFTAHYVGATSRIQELLASAAMTTTFSYGPLTDGSPLVGITHRVRANTISSHTYEHDLPTGNITAWTKTLHSADTIRSRFSYDQADQLTSA